MQMNNLPGDSAKTGSVIADCNTSDEKSAVHERAAGAGQMSLVSWGVGGKMWDHVSATCGTDLGHGLRVLESWGGKKGCFGEEKKK